MGVGKRGNKSKKVRLGEMRGKREKIIISVSILYNFCVPNVLFRETGRVNILTEFILLHAAHQLYIFHAIYWSCATLIQYSSINTFTRRKTPSS